MLKRKFEDNYKIWNWTIKTFSKEKKKYVCECICGNISHVSSVALGNGRSKSCGCLQKEFMINKAKFNDYSSVKNKIFGNYKSAAKRRKYEFNLTKDQFNNLIIQNCFYCNQEPNMIYNYSKKYSNTVNWNTFLYNGVDRKDNSIGYTLDNCVSCCKICNNSKSILSLEDWLNWISRVYTKQTSIGVIEVN